MSNYNYDNIIVKIAREYATYLVYSLVKEGYIDSGNMSDVENDLFIDFYICGKNCEQKFVEGTGAQFTTYLHAAFHNLRNAVYNRYNTECDVISLTDENMEQIDIAVYETNSVEDEIYIRHILRRFQGLELLIIKEILAPSERVETAMYAYCAKFKNHKVTDSMMLYYIKAAYNIPQHIFVKCVQNIKKELKKILAQQK